MRLGKIVEIVFSLRIYVFLFISLCIYMICMFIYEKSQKIYKKTHRLYAICNVILCFLIYMIIGFLVVDIMSMVISIDVYNYIFAIVISVLVTIYGIIKAKHICVKMENVYIGDTKSIQVAFLSDIHIGHFMKSVQLDKIVKKVKCLTVDYVFIVGDTFNDDAFEYMNLKVIAQKFKELSNHKKVYAVLGNHDPCSKYSRVYEFFEKANIELLVDDVREFDDFYIIGRDDITTNPYRKSLDELLKHVNTDKPVTLLDHNPLGIHEVVDHQVNLLLCGHTHKGQFFPATIMTHLAYGKDGFYGFISNKKNILLFHQELVISRCLLELAVKVKLFLYKL